MAAQAMRANPGRFFTLPEDGQPRHHGKVLTAALSDLGHASTSGAQEQGLVPASPAGSITETIQSGYAVGADPPYGKICPDM